VTVAYLPRSRFLFVGGIAVLRAFEARVDAVLSLKGGGRSTREAVTGNYKRWSIYIVQTKVNSRQSKDKLKVRKKEGQEREAARWVLRSESRSRRMSERYESWVQRGTSTAFCARKRRISKCIIYTSIFTPVRGFSLYKRMKWDYDSI
jgi:hypothetical protein